MDRGGGGGDFQCTQPDCGKRFTTKYGLKAHMRRHTGEKPFLCREPGCDKSFKWRSSLVSHSFTHLRGHRKKSAAGRAEGAGTDPSASTSEHEVMRGGPSRPVANIEAPPYPLQAEGAMRTMSAFTMGSTSVGHTGEHLPQRAKSNLRDRLFDSGSLVRKKARKQRQDSPEQEDPPEEFAVADITDETRVQIDPSPGWNLSTDGPTEGTPF